MIAAKGKFYADNDLLAQWFAEECIIGSEYEMPMKLGKEEYNQWLTGGRASTERVGLKEFSADMEAHGYVKKRKNYGGYFFMGIGLKTNVPEDPFA
jgi:phage/plasmid-associated DNA primase